MGDSWEDEDVPSQQPPRSSLNPKAPSFTFNPGARSFVPGQTGTAVASQPDEHHLPHDSGAPGVPSTTDANHEDVDMVDAGTLSSSKDVDMEESVATNGPVAGAHHAAVHAAEQMNGLTLSDARPSPSPAPDEKPAARKAPEPEDDDDLEPEEQRTLELQRIAAELAKEDAREHMNIVFIGHVDAGKSTTGGQILFLTGGVDKRTIEKYEKEAKDKNRESWYMAYIMDTNEEERAKGKTVEVGRAQFQTDKKRYTILDAPGHKNYVPNMISGASQADIGVLVIAARKGEFETGFERGGQTREHAQLARTLGVAKLIIAVNKMDDPSVAGTNGEWSKERYDEIVEKLSPFLKSCGYKNKDLIFLPISGLLGVNIKDRVDAKRCPWYKGGSLFEVLDGVEPLPRDPLAPFRMSVIDKYKDMGTIAMGKSESGIIRKGDKLFVMPNKVSVQVVTIYRDDDEVAAANCGENLRLRLTGIDEDELQAGFVICSRHKPVPCVMHFDAQLQILDLLEHKAIFTAGYKAILHLHSLVEECEVTNLIAQIDKKTGEKKKAKFVKSSSVVICRIAVEKPICAELFSVVPQLGRFTLRDEGRTIAIGKIVKLPKSLRQGTE